MRGDGKNDQSAAAQVDDGAEARWHHSPKAQAMNNDPVFDDLDNPPARYCRMCGTIMVRSGETWLCLNCGDRDANPSTNPSEYDSGERGSD